MLLAGGQGSRLRDLTSHTAKPAVVFGGKYRIIDFTLSNCINSGIDTVGVLTQYQPLALNEYIGNGTPWDLDRMRGGLTLLPPYQEKGRSDWYKGTANAIYQNINFIKRYDPEYVLILAADHIYKMDYSKMLSAHKKKNANCTVATINVPIEEASRFGICNTKDDGRIYEFEEKPKKPKGTKASMGIYIFNTDKLIEYLTRDDKKLGSTNDFGKDVIPLLIENDADIYSYSFDGYWKDVGTLTSLWEANMDLLGISPKLDMHTTKSRILSRNFARPPQFIGENAVIKNSLISEGCEIYGTVINSVLSGGVKVMEGAVLNGAVVFDDVTVLPNAKIYNSIISSDVTIQSERSIGVLNNKSITVVTNDGEYIADSI
jgi:glucose-1-phosphate adenylyltransferase